jgi:nitrite reductase/ring-hydroxylating ferredoxin subunit
MTENLTRDSDLTTVATYRRTIGASAERVWENVLDWEHLPWLHSGSFSDIVCNGAGEWGWRAQVRYPGGDHQSNIELLTERFADRYVTRVLDGPGAGGEVWTSVKGVDAHKTDIVVEFCARVPEGVEPDSMGAGYVALYQGLWDEDERMMQQRQLALDKLATKPVSTAGAKAPTEPIELGTRADLRAKLPLRVEAFGEQVQVVELDGDFIVHSLVCPHSLGPLADVPIVDGEVTCPWHGYRFDVRTGRSCDGNRLRLHAGVRLEVDPQTDVVRLHVAAETTTKASR